METSTTLRYTRDIQDTLGLRAENAIDQRLPGYIEGYVRRFWQVRPLSTL
jgi:hypothetical protein